MLNLKKPHPFIYNYKSIVIPGLITFLLISIFAPFGFQDLTTVTRLIYGFIIGLLSSLSIVLVISGARKLFPIAMQEDFWTVGKEIILFLSVVATICLLIFSCFMLFDLSRSNPWIVFKLVFLYTTLMSIIPITILVLYEQYNFQKQSAKQALSFTENLKDGTTVTEKSNAKSLVRFEAENGKVELQMNHERILYLKADGNYVEIFYLDHQNQVQKQLIRNRLKDLFELLPSHLFFHAHKSYIVNGQHIERIEGNARNFELVINAPVERVPVSRTKSTALSDFLKSMG